MSILNSYCKVVTDRVAGLRILEDQQSKTQAGIDKLNKVLSIRQETQSFIQTAAEITQKTLEQQLCAVVSPALAAVFIDRDPYEFVVNFVQRRNTTECDLMFDRNGEPVDPLSDAGLGPADIASVALKVSNQTSSETRSVLIIDEPLKNLSKSYHTLAAVMFRELSKKLNLQLIVITHVPDLREEANRLITVDMNKEVSYVSQADQ